MKYFKLGFRNRPVTEQLVICQRVADGMARLPKEQRVALRHTAVAAAVAEAVAADEEVGTLRAKLRSALRQRHVKLAAARRLVTLASHGVVAHTGGKPTAMLAAGLELRRDKRPIGQPAAPTDFRAVPSQVEGAVRLRWKRPVRRCSFYVEMSTVPNAKGGWQRMDSCVKQSCELTGLKSGMKHWFRVAAVNAHGQGPWSNPVSVRPA